MKVKFKIFEIESKTMSNWEDIRVLPHETNLSQCFEDPNIIWLQYTGYDDSESAEIYEDDIVTFDEMNYLVVRRDDGSYFLDEIGSNLSFSLLKSHKHVKVIGNKHLNLDLLKTS